MLKLPHTDEQQLLVLFLFDHGTIRNKPVVQNATLFERDTEHGFAFPVLFQSSGKV
jgi:hypothetical protein